MKVFRLKIFPLTVATVLLCGAALGLYVVSILWRVSVAEHEVMGKDLMLHVLKSEREFSEPPTRDSYLAATFTQQYKSVNFNVWRDKINGFQHTYGSALAAYEFGEMFSDKLFAANEFAEWMFDRNGVQYRDLRDRHRDLANNKIGRQIATEARLAGYAGHDADEYMRDRIVKAIEFDKTVITHWCDPKVDTLPTEAELGCPFLPTLNGFDCSKLIRRKIKKTSQRVARKIGSVFPGTAIL